MKGVVSKDHIHLHVSYPPKLSVSDLVKRLKGRTARLLLEEFAVLKKRYWGSTSDEPAMERGAVVILQMR